MQQLFGKKRLSRDTLPRRLISATSTKNGEGVPKDLRKAAQLYQKAANQGYALANEKL
jgi:hypothetical protein